MMSLTQNKKTYQVIVFTSAIVALVIFVPIIFSIINKEDETPPVSQGIVPPTKITLEANIADIKKQIIESKLEEHNGDLLLYKSDAYAIQYITAPDVFFVAIAKDAEKSKKEAQDWFKQKGLQENDLCNISVRFILTNPQLKAENPDFTSLPDGCTGEVLK